MLILPEIRLFYLDVFPINHRLKNNFWGLAFYYFKHYSKKLMLLKEICYFSFAQLLVHFDLIIISGRFPVISYSRIKMIWISIRNYRIDFAWCIMIGARRFLCWPWDLPGPPVVPSLTSATVRMFAAEREEHSPFRLGRNV